MIEQKRTTELKIMFIENTNLKKIYKLKMDLFVVYVDFNCFN